LSHIQQTIQDKRFDVTLRDATREMAMISLQGPKSRAILQSLTTADLSNEAFPFSTNQIIQVSGQKVFF
jgi:sarcosine dehydrogenase